MSATSPQFPVVRPPADAADLGRFLAEVRAHPDTAEVGRRTNDLKRQIIGWGYLDAAESTRDVRDQLAYHLERWSYLLHCDDPDTQDARDHWQLRLANDLLPAQSRMPRGRGRPRPKLVVTLGLPGAGKTSVVSPFIRETFAEFTLTAINPDAVREELPEYAGWNAHALQWEASKVAKEMIVPRALDGWHNILYDIVGRTAAGVLDFVAHAKLRHGYDVYVVLADIPVHDAAGRAWGRFQRNPFGRNGGPELGRYVPLDYLARRVGSAPVATYEQVKAQGLVSGYCRMDMIRSEPGNPHPIECDGWDRS